MSKIINGVEYTTFEDMWNDITCLTQAEKDEVALKVERMGTLIELRDKKIISQQRFEKLAE